MNNNFDIIIIGAGLSGIALAIELTLRTKKTVLILEKKKALKKDKNWCFWNTPDNYFTKKFENKWEEIAIRVKGQEIVKRDLRHSYLHLPSEKFYNEGLRIISQNKKIKLLFGIEAKTIKELNNHVKINTNKGIFYGKILFNSIPKHIYKSKLKQHFFGIEIKSEKPTFDKEKIILMDFQQKKNIVHFFYLLPFSEKRALVETTYFSKNLLNIRQYKDDIRIYLKNKFPNKKFKVYFCEKGILPMYKIKNQDTKRIIQIGTSNNWLKISTGYGFQNAFFNSKIIVDCIVEEKKISIPNKKIGGILDQIFCEFLIKYPNDTQDFFFKFFSGLNLKNIVNFLTERYSFVDIVKVLLKLPKKKLILTALSVLKKKIYYVN